MAGIYTVGIKHLSVFDAKKLLATLRYFTFMLKINREMAYGIMGSTRNSFLSTYQTTQSAKCLYFDGASGALSESGTMDTQMLFLYGNTTGPPGKNSSGEFLWDEYARAQRLCGWLQEQKLDAPGQGIEGIVRMSAGFELIWCNFSSPSLRLVSRFNVSVPLLGYNRTSSLTRNSKKPNLASFATDKGNPVDLPAPDWEIDWEHEPFIASQQWDWFTSASRAYNSEDLASNREPSIRLLDIDLVSLYSPEYQRLLTILAKQEREQLNLTSDGFWEGISIRKPRRNALKELMRRRSRHRVGDLSQQEIAKFRQDMERMTSRIVSQGFRNNHNSRAVSWSHTCDTIVNSFAKRLMQFQQLLQHNYVTECELPLFTRQRFALLRERAHALLMPFFEYSSDIGRASDMQQQSENIQSSLDRCKYAYLPWPVRNEAHIAEQKGMGYHFVGQAIEEVMECICSVLVGTGRSIEKIWLQDFNQGFKQTDDKHLQQSHVEMRKWQDKIEELTAWLGWSPHWMGCDRLCAWDVSNMCHILPCTS